VGAQVLHSERTASGRRGEAAGPTAGARRRARMAAAERRTASSMTTQLHGHTSPGS
jgi:hypothetical protein